MKKKALAISKQHGFESSSVNDIRLFFEKKMTLELVNTSRSHKLAELDTIVKRLRKLELLEFHYSIAQRQRKCYLNFKDNIDEETLFIDFDFKMKIKIGMSPEQVSYEFFKQQTRFVLGRFLITFNVVVLTNFH